MHISNTSINPARIRKREVRNASSAASVLRSQPCPRTHNACPRAPRGIAPPSHTPSSTAAPSLKPHRPEHIVTVPACFGIAYSPFQKEGTLKALIYGGEDEASGAALVWPLSPLPPVPGTEHERRTPTVPRGATPPCRPSP